MFSDFPPLHPVIVHFPVALLLLAGLFGLLSLFVKREFWKGLTLKSLIGGVIFSPLAVITGLIEEQNLEHNEAVHEILIIHKYNGLAILFFFQILIVWYWLRRLLMGNKEYILWVISLLLGTVLVLFQGYLGGEMVFGNGAGVKSMESMSEGGGKNAGGHEHNGNNEMKDMKGMNNSKDKANMEDMEGMDNAHMKDMDNMKDMKGMDNMKSKDGMKGMNMENSLDTFKFEDNNPAWKKAKKGKTNNNN